jgi:spore coat protein U-like protein
MPDVLIEKSAMKTICLIMSTALAMLLIAGYAFADQVSGTMDVFASVTSPVQCTLSVNDLNFGTYSIPAAHDLDASAGISVNCTQSVPYTIDADGGLHSSSAGYRSLADAGDSSHINYNLYANAGYSQVWGTTMTGGAVISRTGNYSYTVYGRIPAGQNPGTGGVFRDIVTVVLLW